MEEVTSTTPPLNLSRLAVSDQRCSSAVGMKRWLLPPCSRMCEKGETELMSISPRGCARKT